MNIKNEEWKFNEDIGRLVSNTGSVKGILVGELKPSIERGYKYVTCSWRGGKFRKIPIHHLVWRSFVGPIKSGYVINHKNYDRGDNRLENLEMLTQKENVIHGKASTTKKRKRRILSSKIKTSILNEEWKIHPTYKREVSNFGRIKLVNGTITRGNFSEGGYLVTTFLFHGKPKNLFIHRLVYNTFIGEIPAGKVINHKDGCKYNNSLDNLEMVSIKENCQHAVDTGLTTILNGSKRSCKLTRKDILQIYTLILKNYNAKEIAKEFNVSSSYICNIKRGKVWKHLHKTKLWQMVKNHSSYYSHLDSVGRSRYKESQVIISIYKMIDNGLSDKEISAKVNFSENYIKSIRYSSCWKDLYKRYYGKSKERINLTFEIANEIRIKIKNGSSVKEMALFYGKSIGCIYDIINGRTFNKLEQSIQ